MPVLAAKTPGRHVLLRDRGREDRDALHGAGDAAVRRLHRERQRAVAAAEPRGAAAVRRHAPHRSERLLRLPARSEDARARLGHPRHAGPRAPHRRHREGRADRQHLVRAGEPREADARARREGRSASRRTSASSISRGADVGRRARRSAGAARTARSARRSRRSRRRARRSATRTCAGCRRSSPASRRSSATSSTCSSPSSTWASCARCCARSSWSTAIGLNKIQGQPFKVREVIAAIEKLLGADAARRTPIRRSTREVVMSEAVKIKLSKKDLESDQDVRWCPGCGDYAILATVQRTLAQLGVKRENTVFISRHRLLEPVPVLHEHVRLPHDPRPRAGDRERASRSRAPSSTCG